MVPDPRWMLIVLPHASSRGKKKVNCSLCSAVGLEDFETGIFTRVIRHRGRARTGIQSPISAEALTLSPSSVHLVHQSPFSNNTDSRSTLTAQSLIGERIPHQTRPEKYANPAAPLPHKLAFWRGPPRFLPSRHTAASDMHECAAPADAKGP